MMRTHSHSHLPDAPSLDLAFSRRSHAIFGEILKTYASPGHPKILDVGCAFGVIGALKGSPQHVFGIERDAALLPMARKNCEKVYTIDLNHFQRDQIAERDFGLVFCGDVLEHVLDPERLLKQLTELLSPDGRVIVSLPNIAQLPFRLKLLLGRFDYTETGVLAKSHLHFYTYKTALDLVRGAGLVSERFYPSGTIVSFINVLPRLLAAQLIFVCRKNA